MEKHKLFGFVAYNPCNHFLFLELGKPRRDRRRMRSQSFTGWGSLAQAFVEAAGPVSSLVNGEIE